MAGSALAIVDKAFSSLKTADAEKAAGYVKGLETRLARAQRDADFSESTPAKLYNDGLRMLGAAGRGGLERVAEGYGQGEAFRRASPYVVAAAWGAGLAAGIDPLREFANGAMLIDIYEVARGQQTRHAAAAEALAADPRYAEAAAYLRAAAATPPATPKNDG